MQPNDSPKCLQLTLFIFLLFAPTGRLGDRRSHPLDHLDPWLGRRHPRRLHRRTEGSLVLIPYRSRRLSSPSPRYCPVWVRTHQTSLFPSFSSSNSTSSSYLRWSSLSHGSSHVAAITVAAQLVEALSSKHNRDEGTFTTPILTTTHNGGFLFSLTLFSP